MNKTLISFIRKEFRQSLRDPSMKQILFVTPVILLLVFGFALVNESRNIRLAVRLDPKDTVLRQVYDRALGTKWFIPGISDPDGDPSRMIDNGDAEAVLIPPPGGLTQSIARGDGKLQLLINGVDVLRAQAIEQYLNAIVTEVATREMNIVTTQPPIHFEVRTLYNPSLSTAAFMLPGTMMLVILQITVVITAMAIAREKETGTYETMISAPISSREIVFGKTIPYILLGMVNIPLLLSVVRFVFHVPIRGSLVLILLCTLIFVCVTVAAGALIGTVTKSQQQAFMLSFLFVFPGVLMSGTFFPVENMPVPLKAIAYINPMTHFLVLLRNLLLKGGNFEVVALHLGVLVLMGVAFGVISFRRMHTTLN